MTIIDCLNTYWSNACLAGHPMAMRSVYITLVMEWNNQRRPQKFYIQHSDIMRRSAVSNSTYYRVLQSLIDTGWLSVNRVKRGLVEIQIIDRTNQTALQILDETGTSLVKLWDNRGTAGGSLNTPAKEDRGERVEAVAPSEGFNPPQQMVVDSSTGEVFMEGNGAVEDDARGASSPVWLKVSRDVKVGAE